MVDIKTRFLRTFANLPLGSRDSIAVVVEDKPMTWNALKLEVSGNTKIGNKGIEILDRLNFIAKDEKN